MDPTAGDEEDSDTARSAETLFNEWKLLGERGVEQPFDQYCDRFPAQAAALRSLLEAEIQMRALYRYGKADPTPSELRQSREFASSVASSISRLSSIGAPYGKYHLRRVIGSGGMGIVFEAEDRLLRRTVALKISTDESADRRKLPLFRREMELAGSLNHPGVVAVHDAGIDEEGRVYLTMPLVEGRNLSEVFELTANGAEDWTVVRAVGVLAQVAETMSYVHSQGVVHRDLKPTNIRVGRFGEVYVMDWGVAKRKFEPGFPGGEGEFNHAEGSESRASTLLGCGTAPYSSPEQLRTGGDVGPATDVYAIGVMLFELLAGRRPYHRVGEPEPAPAELKRRMREERLESIHALARAHPAELASICARAMERDATARYPDCGALAEDLRAFLQQRVVRAHESGTWAETRKWIRRNRALASAVVGTVLLSIGGAAAFQWKAAEAERMTRYFASLSINADLAELANEAERLWPVRSDMVSRYRDWMHRCNQLIDRKSVEVKSLPVLEEWLFSLQGADSDGTAPTPPTSEVAGQMAAVEAQIEWYRRMLGDSPWPSEQAVAAGLADLELKGAARDLLQRAWPLISPVSAKREYGQEQKARLLLERARSVDTPVHPDVAFASRFAELYSGRYDSTDQSFGDPNWGSEDPVMARRRDAILREVSRWRDESERAERRAELMRLEQRRSDLRAIALWRRAAVTDDRSVRWWVEQLAPTVERLALLGSDAHGGLLSRGTSPETGWGVIRRLEAAERLRDQTIDGPAARARWDTALAAIAQSPRYRGVEWPGGRLMPQEGLLPIGPDPRSGLWEFVAVLSGRVPERSDDGELILTEDVGIVLVLVPGGIFDMGAQSSEQTKPGYDPLAGETEGPVRRVRLSPYFIAKYEMTQAQWIHFNGTNPSNLAAGGSHVHSLLHPVEQVSWTDAERTMRRAGLALPSEAQWEFACRAGTSTRWSTGAQRESLIGNVNIADEAARRAGRTWTAIDKWPGFDDTYAATCEIGAFPPNAFGIHEMHGNLWEHCADAYGLFAAAPPGESILVDPLNGGAAESERVARGGGHANSAEDCRVTPRSRDLPSMQFWATGIRPARPIEPAVDLVEYVP
jgi:formylglycine-generating enzyme required for sulfatase activity/serine/threonine protein kinase